ncbi:MAG TPA: hypothetical protein VEL12_01130 [Candidatus Nitrosopolaris sp.]|nr:hypothetical protein [Candidatus Nitrosopolaris sp.]
MSTSFLQGNDPNESNTGRNLPSWQERIVGREELRFEIRSWFPELETSYNCDTIVQMEKAISIRLDEEAQEALRKLTESGRNQSDAVREAIVELARRGQRGDLVAEAKRLSVDREDRTEKARVARLMESLRAAR